jgi:hypothetical protein
MIRWRLVTLLLAIYVAMDLANPMMPGALQLVGASLKAVDGCQSNGVDAPDPLVPAVSRRVAPVVGRREAPLRPVTRAVRRTSASPPPVRSPLEPKSPAASLSDDG